MLSTMTRCFGVLAIAGTATAALAQDLPAPVKARQAHMQLNAFNIGTLVVMAKGETEYDADAATAAASNLAALAALEQGAYWPQGTDNESIEGTAALPAIWENIPDVIEKAEALASATATLSDTAGDGLEALRAGIGPVGKACGACHEDFRAED